MLDFVPTKIHEDVDFYVREYGAGVSLHSHIETKQQKYFPTLLPKYEQSHPEWTEEQRIAAGTQHLMRGEQLLWRGIAKRIVDDDPAELARSASLYARLELWWGTRDECDSFLNFAHDMLRALSAGDTFVIQRFAAVAPQFATSGPWDARVIHNGVIAAINRNDELLAAAVDEFDRWKKPKRYISCIFTAINGLLRKDAALVDEGIRTLLKNSRKLHQDDEILKVISLEAHGLYELCKWYNAELVDQFDCTQGLPWDKQLCDWVAESTDDLPFYDVSSLSPDLQGWLTELPFQDERRHDWT